MYDGFENHGILDRWTPVLFSHELKKRPVALRLAGEKLVLFRDKEGRACALDDRCPHRGVALSLGKVREDGTLECPFHGWRFQGSGACTTVPFNDLPEGKLRLFGVGSYSVRERGGLIWLFASRSKVSPEVEPPVPPLLEAPKLGRWLHAEVWACDWTRAMENMLDSPHLPFVHARTIGSSLRKPARQGAKMDVVVEPAPGGMNIQWAVDGKLEPGGLRWREPNGMELTIPIPGQTLAMHVYCVPIDESHTRMMVASVRSFGRFTGLGRLADQFNRFVLREDKAICESSDPPEVPHPQDEKSVPTDRATLAFRRWYVERRKLQPRREGTWSR